MVLDISLDHLTSHSVTYCPSKVSVLPDLTAPQPLLQTRELAKQPPPTLALYDPHHLPYRPRWRERNQKMHMFFHDFHLHYLNPVDLADFLHDLFRSLPYLDPLEDLFPVLRAPDQMVTRVVDGMTRSPYAHALNISQQPARAYPDKGDFPVPLITPSSRHVFIPRGKPRGILQRVC
jgi:hypothetical protein